MARKRGWYRGSLLAARWEPKKSLHHPTKIHEASSPETTKPYAPTSNMLHLNTRHGLEALHRQLNCKHPNSNSSHRVLLWIGIVCFWTIININYKCIMTSRGRSPKQWGIASLKSAGGLALQGLLAQPRLLPIFFLCLWCLVAYIGECACLCMRVCHVRLRVCMYLCMQAGR